MSRIVYPVSTEKFLPRLVPMSSYEVYVNQVKSSLEAIRFKAKDMEYLPPQLGGLTGQRQILNKSAVIETIDFEVN